MRVGEDLLSLRETGRLRAVFTKKVREKETQSVRAGEDLNLEPPTSCTLPVMVEEDLNLEPPTSCTLL